MIPFISNDEKGWWLSMLRERRRDLRIRFLAYKLVENRCRKHVS